MKKKLKWVLVILLLILAGSGTYAYHFVTKPFSPNETAGDHGGNAPEIVQVQPVQNDKVNILLIGNDQRTTEPSRSDSLILISIDTKTHKSFMVSIPRDSYVNIPDRGMDKITNAHAFGGLDLTVKTVQQFLGVPINYYVQTNFEGFKKVVDILGGVTIKVDKPMIYERIGANFQPGTYRMNGEQALAYVRYRSDEGSDFARMDRQKMFLKQVLTETKKPSTLSKILQLVPAVQQAVITNFTPVDALKYGKTVQESGLETVTLSGEGINIKGIYYLQLNENSLNQLKNKFASN